MHADPACPGAACVDEQCAGGGCMARSSAQDGEIRGECRKISGGCTRSAALGRRLRPWPAEASSKLATYRQSADRALHPHHLLRHRVERQGARASRAEHGLRRHPPKRARRPIASAVDEWDVAVADDTPGATGYRKVETGPPRRARARRRVERGTPHAVHLGSPILIAERGHRAKSWLCAGGARGARSRDAARRVRAPRRAWATLASAGRRRRGRDGRRRTDRGRLHG